MEIVPVITLYQPWATWVMRGWKDIETRTPNRFGCLLNQKVLIHAGQKTDASAINNPYLTKEQLLYNPDEMINGFILGSVFVKGFGLLNDSHSKRALIECVTPRFGLYLKDINRWEIPVLEKGEMGIWYYDLVSMTKVKKRKPTDTILTLL